MVRDLLKDGQRVDFVVNQLNQYSGKKVLHEDYSFIICPYHNDSEPSGRIFHKLGGRIGYKCYGCGTSKSWDELAVTIGLQPFKRPKPRPEFAVPLSLDLDIVASEKLKFSGLPPHKTWRGLPLQLLIDCGCRLCRVEYDWGLSEAFVYMPALFNGETRGYIKARLQKVEDKPSYINSSGKWSVSHGLFPYDYALSVMRDLDSTSVVLVEGPRDALRLLSCGIPAMCILGTQSWSRNKCRLLNIGGVDRVILMMDGDDAGIQANSTIRPLIEEMLDVVSVKLWAMRNSPYQKFKGKKAPSKSAKKAGVSLWDPASMPIRIVNKLKEKYFAT